MAMSIVIACWVPTFGSFYVWLFIWNEVSSKFAFLLFNFSCGLSPAACVAMNCCMNAANESYATTIDLVKIVTGITWGTVGGNGGGGATLLALFALLT